MSIQVSKICASVQSSDFSFIVNPDNILSTDDNRIKVLITPDVLEDSERYQMECFIESLGVSSEMPGLNYGIATYDRKNYTFLNNSPVYFGCDETGKMVLKLGVTQGDAASAIVVPCEVEEVEIKSKRKVEKAWRYTIGDYTVDLETLLDNQGKVLGNFLILDNDEEKYSVPMLIDKAKNFTPEEIYKHFKSGELSKILRNIDSPRVYIACNKAFQYAFQSKTFPQGGVFLFLRNGRIKTTLAGSHPNIKNDISEAQWDIVQTSHPELLVQYRTKVNGVAQMELCALSEASTISFTSAMKDNEGYNWLNNRGGTYPDVVLVHIVRPAQTVTHTPVNTCTNIPRLIALKLSVSPSMAALAEKLLGEGSAQTPQSAQPVSGQPEVKPGDLVRTTHLASGGEIDSQAYGRSSFQASAKDAALDEFIEDFGSTGTLIDLDSNPV